MKQLILFIVAFVAGVTVCSAQGYQLSRVSDGYKVITNFAQARPAQGENRVEIIVTDINSRPVKGARVTVEYFMHSLPTELSVTDITTTARPDGDVYRATLNLGIKGQWKAVVTIAKGI